MAKSKSKAQVVDKWKKKKWHRILAPKIFNEQVIGETTALEPDMLTGRTINVNLMHLTRDMKKQNINVTLEVQKVMGDTAYTGVKKYEMIPSSIKRFVRRGKHRIDDSFVVLTSDNARVRLKPFVIAIGTLKSSITRDLRQQIRNFLATRIKKTRSDVLVQDIINFRIQRELKGAVKKIYPVRICDIRVLQFEKLDKKKDITEEVEIKTEETVKTEETKTVPKEKVAEEKTEKTENKAKQTKDKPAKKAEPKKKEEKEAKAPENPEEKKEEKTDA